MYQRKIVVLIEQTLPQSVAIQRAVAVARVSGAHINICVFVHHSAIDAIGHLNANVAQLAREALMAESQRWVHKQLEQLDTTGIVISTEIIWERLLRSHLVEKVHEQKPDLVIKEIHSEPLLSRLLLQPINWRLQPIDWHLLREGGCDVMLVNADSTARPRRVTAAIDSSSTVHSAGHLNERIVAAAREMAALLPCDLEVAHAFEGLSPAALAAPLASTTGLGEVYEQLRKLNTQQFKELANKLSVPAEHQHLRYGEPWLVLPEQAGELPGNLLVLGCVQRSGFESWVLGSTAERILDSARCDLLVVRPDPEVAVAPRLQPDNARH